MEIVNLSLNQYGVMKLYGQFIKIDFGHCFVLKNLFNDYVLSFNRKILRNEVYIQNKHFVGSNYISFYPDKIMVQDKLLETISDFKNNYKIDKITPEKINFRLCIDNDFSNYDFLIKLLESLLPEKFDEIKNSLFAHCIFFINNPIVEVVCHYLLEKNSKLTDDQICSFVTLSLNTEFGILYLEKNKNHHCFEMIMVEFLKFSEDEILFNFLYNNISDFDYTHNGDSFISFCVLYNKTNFIHYFLEKSTKNINLYSKKLKNPIIIAIKQNNKEVVELLLKNGADPNSLYKKLHTLDICSGNIRSLLVQYGADEKLSLKYYNEGYKDFFKDIDVQKIDLYYSRFLESIKNNSNRKQLNSEFNRKLKAYNLKIIFDSVKYKGNKAYNIPELSNVIVSFV